MNKSATLHAELYLLQDPGNHWNDDNYRSANFPQKSNWNFEGNNDWTKPLQQREVKLGARIVYWLRYQQHLGNTSKRDPMHLNSAQVFPQVSVQSISKREVVVVDLQFKFNRVFSTRWKAKKAYEEVTNLNLQILCTMQVGFQNYCRHIHLTHRKPHSQHFLESTACFPTRPVPEF